MSIVIAIAIILIIPFFIVPCLIHLVIAAGTIIWLILRGIIVVWKELIIGRKNDRKL